MLTNFIKVMVLFGLMILTENLTAEELKAKMLDDNPSYCEMFYYFNGGDIPDECPKPRMKRGIHEPLKPNTIAFSKAINFEFDSAQLTPNSITVLNDFTAMVQHEKVSQKFIRLEGHTDHVGTADYNQRLSEQRAVAVKRFLVQHGVNSSRIETIGYGFRKLRDPDHPDDGINRRVEFANLGE